MRWSNADPVTGQAAWYDLRVSIEKAEPGSVSEPHLEPLREPAPAQEPPSELRYGQEWAH